MEGFLGLFVLLCFPRKTKEEMGKKGLLLGGGDCEKSGD